MAHADGREDMPSTGCDDMLPGWTEDMPLGWTLGFAFRVDWM